MNDNILIIFAAYLLGSIPFGLLLTRAAGLGDVRSIGSGNIGATNVMRTGKKWLGILTLLLDMGKGYASVWLAVRMGVLGSPLLTIGMAAILGHIFPAWLKFKGGKGVATALGVLVALDPTIGLEYTFFWLAVLLMSRYVSLASILGFWCVFTVHLINNNVNEVMFLALLALLISYTHRANVVRMRDGVEPQIGGKKL